MFNSQIEHFFLLQSCNHKDIEDRVALAIRHSPSIHHPQSTDSPLPPFNMDAEEGQAPAPSNVPDPRNVQVDNAIRAIKEKKPLPEIDFSIHTMEDGSQVSTMERVCKGRLSCLDLPVLSLLS